MAAIVALSLPPMALSQSTTATADNEVIYKQLDSLSKDLEGIESALAQPWRWRSHIDDIRSRIDEIAGKAEGIRKKSEQGVDRQSELLRSLAPLSGSNVQGAKEERDQRKGIENELSKHRARVNRATLIIAKSKEIKGRITTAATRLRAEALLSRRTTIADETIWRGAAKDLSVASNWALGMLGLSPTTTGTKEAVAATGTLSSLLFLLVVAWVLLRLTILGIFVSGKRKGKDSAGHGFGRIARAILVLDLALPAVALLGVWMLRHLEVISEVAAWLLFVALGTTAATLVVASIVSAMPGRAVAFDRFAGEQGQRLARALVTLSAVIGLNFFLYWSQRALANVSDLFWLGGIATQGMAAALILSAMGCALRGRSVGPAGGPSIRRYRERRTRRPALPGPWLWMAPTVVVVVAPAIYALGYKNLSEWLFFGILSSTGVLLVIWFANALAGEAIPLAMRRWLRPAIVVHLGLRFSGRRRRAYTYTAIGLVQASAWAVGLVAILLLWGVPAGQLVDWAEALFTEVRIGTIQFSLVDILIATAVFLGGYAVTRILQHFLVARFFPRFDFDIGARNAMRSGVGYFGITIAVIVAVLSLGVELTHLAIVAGGLSVGIGFGLQAIANNFISGLIMLAERPIKEGDWVVIKDHEGLVKHISFRATELQTFQKAAVLIPNSEVISGTVTNWTFKDLTSRVDVIVAVPYDTDVRRMRELLLTQARKHPKVLRNPEPQVNLRELGDSKLVFELWAYIQIRDVTDKMRVESDLRQDILAALRVQCISHAGTGAAAVSEEAVVMPTPAHTVAARRMG